jgi:hypothetical protein
MLVYLFKRHHTALGFLYKMVGRYEISQMNMMQDEKRLLSDFKKKYS